MNLSSNLDRTIDQLVHVRKVTAYANLGIYAGPTVLRQAIRNLEAVKESQSDVVMERSEAALHAMSQNILPGQQICQASMAEVDKLLIPLRAQRRGEQPASYERPRPN